MSDPAPEAPGSPVEPTTSPRHTTPPPPNPGSGGGHSQRRADVEPQASGDQETASCNTQEVPEELPESAATVTIEREDEEDLGVMGYPSANEPRPGPEGAEGEDLANWHPLSSVSGAPQDPRSSSGASNDPDDVIRRPTQQSDDEEEEEEYDSVPATITSSQVLPWGAPKERPRFPSSVNIDIDIRPGEFVMRTLFAEFTIQVEKKISGIMVEPLERPLSKSLQRGEDPQFDQLLSAFGSVAEHCLPSLLKTLFAWYDRQGVEWIVSDYTKGKGDSKGKSDLMNVRSELEWVSEKRDLAVEFIFCLVLIEVLKQLSVHPGHEDLVHHIEDIAFKHFKYRDTATLGPNAANIHMIADLYAEVLGVLAMSRFLSIRRKFFAELRELRSREPSAHVTQSIISLLMGMKFFRVKMVPFEDFEHSFQFMQECAQYFLEVKDKDIKHAVAGLFVEILVPVAAAVKNEVNVPCLKNFVERLYSQTLDLCTKNKHRLAIFPLVTCLLCVSQKAFFLHNWHYFLTMCLQQLKSRDTKMARVALESLYRLLWVYMIRIKCESNNVTQSRLQSIVNSLFPKGSKAVVPRDAPLNIFVKIIQFIAQEKLDFAMREIVFDLLSVGRPIKVINAPERMSIGLRSFLVVADSLQQKEGEPPMPRTVTPMPSGSTMRVKKTFLSKMLTDETAKNIGISAYYPYVRKVFDDILRALDTHFGKPYLKTNAQNMAKEADDAKPKLDLFRTVVAAIPRLIPDGMSRGELVDTLSRLTVHSDEELSGLAYLGLQNLVSDFPDWREDVLYGFMQFVVKEICDQQTTLLDNALRVVTQLLSAWRNAATDHSKTSNRAKQQQQQQDPTKMHEQHNRPDVATTLHMAEGFALVMLCHCRISTRKISYMILKEVKHLFKVLDVLDEGLAILDALDKSASAVVDEIAEVMPAADKAAAANSILDFQWLVERSSSHWTSGFNEDGGVANKGCVASLFVSDPWSAALMAFLTPARLPRECASAVLHTWPTVHTRITQIYAVVDPNPVPDNRASLLRPGTAPKKPLNEKDIWTHLWKNYIVFACRVVPPVPNPVVRCVSPDLMLSSPTPESLGSDRSDSKSPSAMVSPTVFYKLIVPILKNDMSDVKDSVVQALGRINHNAIMDLMLELVPYIRDAIDRKQENMRRRRRRDALRLQLVKVFDLIAKEGTLARAATNGAAPVAAAAGAASSSSANAAAASAASASEAGSNSKGTGLLTTFTEYIDGARIFLEGENDKDLAPIVRDIKFHFSAFIRNLINGFSLDRRPNLLKRDLRRNLFRLFAGWSGKFGAVFGAVGASGAFAGGSGGAASGGVGGAAAASMAAASAETTTDAEFQFSALRSMIAVLCCGPCFDAKALLEEGALYSFLDGLLNSRDKKVYDLAQDTLVLLLEFNTEIPPLLDWVVDKCFTGSPRVADACFMALATIFATREYPCDHYTAIINVTLMNTGCPRTLIHDTALQLLQILDRRFFGSFSPLGSDGESDAEYNKGRPQRSTLDVTLSTTYSRSQLYLSRQLAQLHPELTMPMFSEICHRLQTARPSVTKCLLYYLLPWLYNMELVDPNININSSNNSGDLEQSNNVNSSEGMGTKLQGREGWGTPEATEMITNNLFYITVKFGDEHPKEVEELWSALCVCWPQNLKIIVRYLFIVSGMAPQELIECAKRVALYVARAQPVKTLEEMMNELQTVETLNFSIERTETPPFYRLSLLRKASSNSESNIQLASSRQDVSSTEKGTIHTKRHSQEEQQRENSNIITAPFKSAGSMASSAGSAVVAKIQMVGEKVRQAYTKPSVLGSSPFASSASMSQSLVLPSQQQTETQNPGMSHSEHQYMQSSVNFDYGLNTSNAMAAAAKLQQEAPKEVTSSTSHHYCASSYEVHSHPHPLPMPEYGGWFAPLNEFLPSPSVPISTFHRCNLAAILITDLVVDGLNLDCHSVDWSVHVPLMLHIVFLGLDNNRELVNRHCQQLLVNLLTVLCHHNDHLTVSSILMHCKTEKMNHGLVLPSLPVLTHNFTDHMRCEADEYIESNVESNSAEGFSEDDEGVQIKFQSPSDHQLESGVSLPPDQVTTKTSVSDLTKALIHFIASRQCQPLWQYEDITRTVWSIRSAAQMDVFLQHVLHAFELSLPRAARIAERWSQLTLQIALSCSSRHYAGRSLQIFRALRVPITSRMLSDILSRLVETIAEQGEDMQGYVTELILTLESVVDALDSDIRPMDHNRDIFKSTPNLKDMAAASAAGGNAGRRSAAAAAAAAAHAAAAAAAQQHRGQEEENDEEEERRQQTLSPIGHNYHISAPPSGPFSRFPYQRGVSYHPSSSTKKPHLPSPTSPGGIGPDIRGRSSTESEGRHGGVGLRPPTNSSTLSRSRSAQSLKLQDQASQEDKMNILVQLFWICLAVLESDYEHEFLLGLRLLDRVLARLPLDRPDVREKLEKLQVQLKWPTFPGLHSLLLKGCTNPATYESTVKVLSQMTLLLNYPVIDPSQSLAFPMNVIAMLPYMVQNYEDANELCINSAENIAQVSTEKNKKLENLATVMTLYSRRTFSKESFQWTKCVVKYLHDLYSHFSLNMLCFLVEVLEKGPQASQAPVMTIIHCLLHYVDMHTATQMINADLLRTVARFVETPHWREALKILKLAVTRSSTLVAPPPGGSSCGGVGGVSMSGGAFGGAAANSNSSSSVAFHWETAAAAGNFSEGDLYFKKELPGRTMEFTFDLSQTPVIGRRQQAVAAAAAAVASAASTVSSASGRAAPWSRPPVGATASAASTMTASTLAGLSSLPDDSSRAGGESSIGGGSISIAGGLSGGGTTSTVSPFTRASLAVALRQASADLTSGLQVGGGSPAAPVCLSPRRSLSAADSAATSTASGWKRPWLSQSAVRERLVNLLNSCGQRVGLPKSPSGDNLSMKVIFSQTSELLERQSSMASSTEEVSTANHDLSNESKQPDTTDTEQRFGMYMREFDFLEYELESLEGESVDNFNWGVRRPSLSHLDGGDFRFPLSQQQPQHERQQSSSRSSSSRGGGGSGGGGGHSERHLDSSPQHRPRFDDDDEEATSATATAAAGEHQQRQSPHQSPSHRLKQPPAATTASGSSKRGASATAAARAAAAAARAAGIEESSDDEFGSMSARSTDDPISGSSSSSSALFPPTSLPLDAIAKRDSRFSPNNSGTETGSDTDDDDDEGEMTDHDLTPCNTSPSIPFNWGGAGVGGAGPNRIMDMDEIEESWKTHVGLVMQTASNESLMESFIAFGRLFAELRCKTCVISQDALLTLTKERAPFSQDLIKAATANLQQLSEILADVTFFPNIWCEFDNIGGASLVERIKFIILEIQENFENYTDKKEYTIECLEAVKAHEKLVSLGEDLEHYNIDTEQVDLCRCLYKQHFQLLLLLESFAKLLGFLSQNVLTSSCGGEPLQDRSKEVRDIWSHLVKAGEALAQQIDEERDKKAKASPEAGATTKSSCTQPGPCCSPKSEDDEDLARAASDNSPQPPRPSSATNPDIRVTTDDDVEEEDDGDEDLRSINSSEISAAETVAFEARSRRESEYHVFGLVCETKYHLAVAYYRRKHVTTWSHPVTAGTKAPPAGLAGPRGNEEDAADIVKIYCQILAERGENIFVMTVSEEEIQGFCSRLMASNLQFLSTVQSMENQLARQKQMPPASTATAESNKEGRRQDP